MRLSAHWLMLAVTAALFGLVATLVDLKPHVDENFFFSTSDPQFQESKKIDELFPAGSQIVLSVSSSEISSARYLERLDQLTQKIKSIDSVTGVRSLTDGPNDFADAEKSPFWKRLLIANNRQSSNIVAFVHGEDSEQLIRRVENIVREFDRKDFRIRIAAVRETLVRTTSIGKNHQGRRILMRRKTSRTVARKPKRTRTQTNSPPIEAKASMERMSTSGIRLTMLIANFRRPPGNSRYWQLPGFCR